MDGQNYKAFKNSLKFAIGGLLCLILIPISCSIVDDGIEGWDDLDNKLNVIFYGALACLILFLISFIFGVRTIRERKIVLLWIVPIGIILLATFTYALAYIVGPYWKADWI